MHLTGAAILAIFIAVSIAVIVVLLHFTRAGQLLHENIQDRPRRRFFLASISFFITFFAVRAIVYCITHHIAGFGFVIVGGAHIHHLVWGILILLAVGYGWLAEFGNGTDPSQRFASVLMSLLYGVGAALTLDEFAIWLYLDPNAYWGRQNRDNIDAIILMGALLGIGAWGAPFFAALAGWRKKAAA